MGRPFVILFVIAAALLVARCSTEEARLRYRLTLTVRTPEGLRSGSSVLELALARKNLIPLPGVSGADWGGGFRSRGEAPFVDLGGGRTLFATVRAPDGDYRRRMTSVALAGLDLYRLRGAEPHGDSDRRIMRALDRAKPLKALAEKDYPLIGIFRDLDDPKTFVEVAPGTLSAAFGSGHALEAITLQVVDRDTPLTTHASSRFPALTGKHNLLVL